MTRLVIVCEGKTEATFTKLCLGEWLGAKGVSVQPRLVVTSSRGKGGGKNFQNWERTLSHTIREVEASPTGAVVTMMLDYYGLDAMKNVPGIEESRKLSKATDRVATIEKSIAELVCTQSSSSRFVPHLQLHEFESLLLTDPICVSQVDSSSIAAKLHELSQAVSAAGGPERVNDGIETSPSKRIISAAPDYARLKAEYGPLVAKLIGLPRLRDSCPHFDAWLARLEVALGVSQG